MLQWLSWKTNRFPPGYTVLRILTSFIPPFVCPGILCSCEHLTSISQWPLRRRRTGAGTPPVTESVKIFPRSPENVHRIWKNAGERTALLQTELGKTGCRAFHVRAISGASAPERARRETSTPIVYDRSSIEENGRRSGITPSRSDDLQRASENAQSRSDS